MIRKVFLNSVISLLLLDSIKLPNVDTVKAQAIDASSLAGQMFDTDDKPD